MRVLEFQKISILEVECGMFRMAIKLELVESLTKKSNFVVHIRFTILECIFDCKNILCTAYKTRYKIALWNVNFGSSKCVESLSK